MRFSSYLVQSFSVSFSVSNAFLSWLTANLRSLGAALARAISITFTCDTRGQYPLVNTEHATDNAFNGPTGTGNQLFG